MDVKVHENYEQIDKENVERFSRSGTSNPEDDVYRCVICGCKACIGNSVSCMGHRLMHTSCMEKTFGFGNILEAFKWMEEQDK